jgi:transcriptional regulator with GAF, ATPase, and Fis domain
VGSDDDEETFKSSTVDLTTRLVVAGMGISATHTLPRAGEVVLGRSSEADIKVPDASVSRKHARLKLAVGSIEIADLGSANGTSLNNKTLAPHELAPVRSGDVIRVGDVAILVRGPARKEKAAPAGDGPIVVSERMKSVYALAERVARASSVNVLILGETGVGKEVVAKEVHRRSPRAAKPFLGLNCAAFTETLLESELFGHEKGSFTGADQAKPGLFETADGGTLFLDEVGELPATFQAKLLRVIEEKKVRRVGGLVPRPIDVRLLAATNRDLEREVARGSFRGDLYYRLDGFRLVVPPLRERVEEIEPLARHYAALFCREVGMPAPEIAPDAADLLRAHEWPGNVRELKNVIQRAVLLSAGGPITVDRLPERKRARPAAPEPGAATGANPLVDHAKTARLPALLLDEKRETVESLERRRIHAALEECAGNQTRAAKLLGISRRGLCIKLEKYGLPRPRKTPGDQG